MHALLQRRHRHPPRAAATKATTPAVAPAVAAPQPADAGSAAQMAAAAFCAAASLLLATPAAASASDALGKWAASGLLIKDSVEVSALADKDLPGVVVYLSDFKLSFAEKLNPFKDEPSQASLTCAIGTGSDALSQETTDSLVRRLGGGGSGVEVFSERKGLNVFKNKTLRVRRLIDGERRAAVYVAYSTRLGTAGDEGGKVSAGRYRTSICAVPLPAYSGGGGGGGGGGQEQP
jgi:catabolite regulation protein CreA